VDRLSLEWRVPYTEQAAMLVAINPPPDVIVCVYREPDDRRWCFEIFDVHIKDLFRYQTHFETGFDACLACEFELAGSNELRHVEPGRGKIVWR